MDTVRRDLTCLRCGYRWFSTVKRPKHCANKRCKSTLWDKAGSKRPPRKRGALLSLPVDRLRVGEFVIIPYSPDERENSKRIDSLRRYSKRSGKQFERVPTAQGLKIRRLHDREQSPI